MAIDNTPPRLKLIVTIAIITVVTLVSLDFVFKSYYAMMTDEAVRDKIAPTRDKDEQRKAEQTALTSASIPIEQAMAQFGKGARPDSITPQPSEDLAPMTGWSKMPKPVPSQAAPAHVEPTGAGVGDGGVAAGADAGGAGAPHATTTQDAGSGGAHRAATDAGVPRPRQRVPRPPEPGAPAPPAPAPPPEN